MIERKGESGWTEMQFCDENFFELNLAFRCRYWATAVRNFRPGRALPAAVPRSALDEEHAGTGTVGRHPAREIL